MPFSLVLTRKLAIDVKYFELSVRDHLNEKEMNAYNSGSHMWV